MAERVHARLVPLLLLAACGALCQERQETQTPISLPDAPSAETARSLAADGQSSIARAAGLDAILTCEAERTSDGLPPRSSFEELEQGTPGQRDSDDFLEKHLYSSLLKRNLSYHPSTSTSFMGRATYAAESIFVTRDDSGRRRLNTAYFVGVLTSAFVHTASRPYWRRSPSDPFSDFGSNIGNDAGMNLVHEFGPGIQQLMKSHAPKFVSRIEEHISHNRE